MKNLWNDKDAEPFTHSDLALRVYTSRLLGQNENLVLHGGGNTSVKTIVTDIFGDKEEILYVKGSGWDLKTIEEAGFSPTRLDVIRRLGQLSAMTDMEMTRELAASMIDPGAPSPSVETILHGLIPLKYVDHSHTDAVVAISNTLNGADLLKQIYADRVLILPYVMPGFKLAKQVYEATRNTDWRTLEGIILLHHGLFTFHGDAKTSYDNMINLVSEAEEYLKSVKALSTEGEYEAVDEDYLKLAKARKAASNLFGYAMLANWKRDQFSIGYSSLDKIEDIATRGPVTPDHTLQTKRIAAILSESPAAEVDSFGEKYQHYFDSNTDGNLVCLDTAPRFAVWKNKGCIVFAPNVKRSKVISDILDHTIIAVQCGEVLGGWQALPEKDIFEIEYWELEQAKLKLVPKRNEFDGKVVLVTGAASGIGKACVEAFSSKGAAVVALDINPEVEKLFDREDTRGIVCDITSDDSIRDAVHSVVASFGGVDVLVSNAGSFPASTRLEQMESEFLRETMQLNFNAHVGVMRACVPFLKLGFDPSIILMASKNVPAPGPGAGAYSAAKSALTQMGRVAAMELGEEGIRVNMVHPNAVFDTGIWTQEVLQKRAASYGLSVDEYKTNNLLGAEITSVDVAEMVVTMAGKSFAKTTGAQVPVDGGNDRVV
jgi:rhamnose utilization protein RhaD (predicted bifunctional aldolase and dehydrogenase)/NAD(P)-dependent dehydrogenase (short-subunit alcohol dehydrogenase family)